MRQPVANSKLENAIFMLQNSSNKMFLSMDFACEIGVEQVGVYPTKAGKNWWLAHYITLDGARRYHTKNPCNLKDLCSYDWFVRAITSERLIAVQHEPVDGNFLCWQPKQEKTTNIYIIQAVIGGPVKIGKADNVPARLERLQVYCPFELRVLKIYPNVPHHFERFLHRKFKDYRQRGEWFSESVLSQLPLK